MRVTIYTRDYVLLGCLAVLVILVFLKRDDYAKCQDPLGLWLGFDYLAFIVFRAVQFAFQYASNRRRVGIFAFLPRCLLVFNLYVLYPFLWAWTVLGCVWYNRSKNCLPQDNNQWSYVIWLSFSFFYLAVFGLLIVKTRRMTNQGAGSVEHMRALLSQYQTAHSYGLEAPREGLTDDEIAEIPQRVVTVAETMDRTCSICIAEIQTGEAVRQIPCHHLFHVACLDQWLQINARCPNCVQPIGTEQPDAPLLHA